MASAAAASSIWSNFTTATYVNGIVESKSHIWVVTDAGLVAIGKGNRSPMYLNRANSPLTSNYLTRGHVDTRGKLWVTMKDNYHGQGHGLARYDGSDWTVFTEANSDFAEAWTLDSDPSGALWFSRRCDLHRYDGDALTTFDLRESGVHTWGASTIRVVHEEEIWVGLMPEIFVNVFTYYGGGLGVMRSGKWETFTFEDSELPTNAISSIVVDARGNAWIGSWSYHDSQAGYVQGGLSRFDGRRWINFNSENSPIPPEGVIKVAMDRDGEFWILADGLLHFDGIEWTIFDAEAHPLLDWRVRDLLLASDGTIWVASAGAVLEYDGTNWIEHETSNSSLPSMNVTALGIDAQGELWCGTHGGLAYRPHRYGIVYRAADLGLSSARANRILLDSQQKLWVATRGGLAGYVGDGQWDQISSANAPLPSDSITDFGFDQRDRLWIASVGVHVRDGDEWTHYRGANSGLPHDGVNSVLPASDGSVYAGTRSGLYRFDGVDWTEVYGGSHVNIGALHQDGMGRIWALGNGVVMFDGLEWRVFNPENSGLPVSTVASIAEDGDGNLWFGTGGRGGGLVRYDGQDWQTYSFTNSRISDVYALEALLVDQSGNVWVGDRNGGLSVLWKSGTVTPRVADRPTRSMIAAIYPNPFNPRTTVEFTLSSPSHTKVRVFDAASRLVQVLQDGNLASGMHRLSWNGEDVRGRIVSSGIYYIHLETEWGASSRAVTLLK